jgi:hypothetical protein
LSGISNPCSQIDRGFDALAYPVAISGPGHFAAFGADSNKLRLRLKKFVRDRLIFTTNSEFERTMEVRQTALQPLT